MSQFKSLVLSYEMAQTQLASFRSWFARNATFKERDVHNELKKYDHLCLLIGFLGGTRRPDRFKHEFQIGGVFRADYVVACSSTRQVTFVELEGGEANSLFGPGKTAQLRDWGAQIQRGFSQIADWTWAKSDLANSSIFQNALGFPDIREKFVVICGRDSSLESNERRRLDWRSEKTHVAGSLVLFMTYDDLLLHFEGQLDVYREAFAHAKGHAAKAST